MFPNVRLLIGALFITVAVLSCEFAVFAALRVNREPLSRLTSESAPLQLVAGKNAPPALPISWSVPRDVQVPAGDAQTGVATVEVPLPQPVERAVDAPLPSNADAASTLDIDNQTHPAVLQTALAPSPPAPAPAADAAAPVAQAPVSPPANTLVPAIAAAPANPEANVVPGQDVPAPAIKAAAGNPAPEQPAAAPALLAAVPAQQTPAAEIAKPAEAEPPQAALQAHEIAAPAGEPPAASAPALAAIAPAAAEPAATRPIEITGSVPNAAMPETGAPKAAAPRVKPVPKIVHKPVAKKPHKIARAPAPPHHPVKKRIARARPAAAASTAQPATDFNNPVFQSAPEFQRPRRSRAGAKNTATNNGFSNTFSGQFGTQ